MGSNATFDIGYVGPNQSSQATLSGPGVFSLSSRSNVPYVALIGRSGFQKVFSWGEIVEIPQHEQCTVKNASYHGGDIVINGGADYDTRPACITIPVPTLSVEIEGEADPFLSGEFPADVRMARKAYFVMDAHTGLVNTVEAVVIGKRQDGSHNTFNQINFEPGTGYQEQFLIPIHTDFGLIPLGKGSVYGGDPHPMALLTTARVFLSPIADIQGDPDPDNPNSFNAYYVVEY